MNLFQKTDVEIVYADIDMVDSTNTEKVIRKWKSGNYTRESFKWGWMPPHPTLFVKKEVYDKFGVFNLQFNTSADYELMLRFLYKYNVKAAYLPRVIIKMRTGGYSGSSLFHRIYANKEDKLAWEINNLKPYFFTTWLKPLRKIIQYL